MTHLVEVLLIASIVASGIMLMILIMLKVGITVTSRPLTKEEIEKLESRKWPWSRKSKVETPSVPMVSTESAETSDKPKEVVESYAKKEITTSETYAESISKDAGIDSKCSFYRKRFLVCKRASNRSHIYIDRECATLIKKVLPIIAPDASISGFVSNIVADHLEKHKQEIIKMYNDKFSKIM